jgi:hypothetical protein
MLSIAMRGCLLALGLSGAVAGCLGDDGGVDRSRDGRPASTAAVFRELEGRSLNLPRVDLHGRSIREYGVAGRCVEGPGTPVNAIVLRAVRPPVAALGPWPPGPSHTRGPVYAALLEGAPRIVFLSELPPIRDSRSWLVRTLWISRPSYNGPLLVRGGRLDRPGALGFGAGLPPRESLRLPAGAWTGIGVESRGEHVDAREGWRVAAVPTRIRGPGCYAFQVDGLRFSYVLAFGVQAEAD